MKRKSIAEQTLQRQIDRMNRDIEAYAEEARKWSERVETTRNQRMALESEMGRLETKRIHTPPRKPTT